MVEEENAIEKQGEEMKRFLITLIVMVFLSGCVGITTGPETKYVYPDAPDYPMVQYMSPIQSETNGICVRPIDQGEILKHEVDWEITYEKMKAIIDAINEE